MFIFTILYIVSKLPHLWGSPNIVQFWCENGHFFLKLEKIVDDMINLKFQFLLTEKILRYDAQKYPQNAQEIPLFALYSNNFFDVWEL